MYLGLSDSCAGHLKRSKKGTVIESDGKDGWATGERKAAGAAGAAGAGREHGRAGQRKAIVNLSTL